MPGHVYVDLEAVQVVVHERGLWCPRCALPSAVSFSFTLVCTAPGHRRHQVGPRVERHVACCECGHNLS